MIQIQHYLLIDTVGVDPIAPFDPVIRILAVSVPSINMHLEYTLWKEENFYRKDTPKYKTGETPILNDSWLEDYASNSNTHFCRNTMYDRTKILWSRRVRRPHRHYQPIKHKGCVQSLQVLLYTFPKDKVHYQRFFPLARDVPLGKAEYTLQAY